MRKKVCILIAALLLLSKCLSGCYHTEYKGEYPELYTVAVYNFLGRAGCWSNGEVVKDSEIELLETDSYGRVMFLYHEGISDWGRGYGILQKSQDGYAYFYEDDCVLVSGDVWNGHDEYFHEKWFIEEELDAFKVRNDWDQPLNEEKCTKKAIVIKEPAGKRAPKKSYMEDLAKSYWNKEETAVSFHTNRDAIFLTEDSYGRELYWMYSWRKDDGDNSTYSIFAIIINPDGTCDGASAMLLLNDYTWGESYEINSREALKEFKQQNGWNTEYIDN